MTAKLNPRWPVPANWAWTTLSQLGDIVGGGTPSTKDSSYWGDEIPWISPSDLTGYSNKEIKRGAKSISKRGLANSSAVVMPAGSVHFSSRAPVGHVVISSQPTATNQGFKSLVPATGVLNTYVYYYLLASREYARTRASGTTFLELSGRAFGQLAIPLAPTNAQHSIVSRIEVLLSELDKGIASLKEAQAQLAIYRQAMLKQAFEGKLTAHWRSKNKDSLEPPEQLLARVRQERMASDEQRLQGWEASSEAWVASGKVGRRPVKPRFSNRYRNLDSHELFDRMNLPFGWIWTRFGSIFDVVSGGTPAGLAEATGTEIPFYKVADMNTPGNEVRMKASSRYISEEERSRFGLTSYPPGTVIFPKRGGAILTNKKRILSTRSCFDLNTMGVVNRCGSISSDYLWHWFQGLDLKDVYDGSNVPQINNKNIEPLTFPLCGRSEQNEIVRILSATISNADSTSMEIDEQLQNSRALRQAILKRAFAGRLVPQDHTDEPASVLLDRIRAERVQATKRRTRPKIGNKR